MITTREIDANKEDKDRKLQIIKTDKINQAEPNKSVKLKPAAGPLVTTRNVESIQKKNEFVNRMKEARAMKAAEAKKKAQAQAKESAPKEEPKKNS